MKEVMKLRRRQAILSGRVMGAFFVLGEVEFELGALELLQTIKRSTSWKRALCKGGRTLYFGCSRAVPQLFHSLTVAQEWERNGPLDGKFEPMVEN